MSQKRLELENAKLRHALAAETAVLKSVREVALDALRPGVTAEAALQRLWDENETALDEAPEIAAAEELLHPDKV